MPLKVKRQKRKKTIRHTNRKKIRRKHNKTPNIQLKAIREVWDDKISVRRNLESMGLAVDPNEVVTVGDTKIYKKVKPKSVNIVTELEKDAKAQRVKKFKYPTAQAMYLTHLIKKYGDNYKAMQKDERNIYQETWKKIRAKISQFRKIEQYAKFFPLKPE